MCNIVDNILLHTHIIFQTSSQATSVIEAAAAATAAAAAGLGVWSEFLKYLRLLRARTHTHTRATHMSCTRERKRSEGYPCLGIKQIRDPQCGSGIMCVHKRI